MKIRLHCSIAGPGGVYSAGSVLDTTQEEADSFVRHGMAEYITEPEGKPSAAPEIETAESKEVVKRETTAGRITRRKRK